MEILSWSSTRQLQTLKDVNTWNFTNETESTISMAINRKGDRVLFDADDLYKVKLYKAWYLMRRTKWVKSCMEDGTGENGNKRMRCILLHRCILPGYNVVKHINNNTLDCRKVNLRGSFSKVECNNNRILSKSNKSGTSGVHLSKKGNYWVSCWAIRGKNFTKTFGFGPKSLMNEEEAMNEAIAHRKQMNAITGCKNGFKL